MGRNIGIKGIRVPEEECDDKNCPFHGNITVRGRTFKGLVTSAKMNKGVVIKFQRIKKYPKYERYGRSVTKLKAHNPECIDAEKGDVVTIMETRPISKTIHFVVVKKESGEE